jgi:hypothetical protein
MVIVYCLLLSGQVALRIGGGGRGGGGLRAINLCRGPKTFLWPYNVGERVREFKYHGCRWILHTFVEGVPACELCLASTLV